MSRFDDNRAERQRIQQQTDAEYAFAGFLEAQGVNCEEFRKRMRLTRHKFNVLAQYLYGVNEEEPTLTPVVKASGFSSAGSVENANV